MEMSLFSSLEHLVIDNIIILLSKHLFDTNKYRVFNIDLPGLGSRSSEKLSKQSAIQAVNDIINTHCKSKKVLLFGYSMGGYLTMHFIREYGKLLHGVIIGGSSNSVFGTTTNLLYSSIGAMYKVTPKSVQWKFVPSTFPDLNKKKKMELVFMRNELQYDTWPECYLIMKEPHENYYLECIKSFDGPILFINGEKDIRIDESLFVESAKNGKLHVVKGGSHMMALEDGPSEEFHQVMLEFCKEIGIELTDQNVIDIITAFVRQEMTSRR